MVKHRKSEHHAPPLWTNWLIFDASERIPSWTKINNSCSFFYTPDMAPQKSKIWPIRLRGLGCKGVLGFSKLATMKT